MPSEAVNIWCGEMVEGPRELTFGGEIVEISESERPHQVMVDFVSHVLRDAARNAGIVYPDRGASWWAEVRSRHLRQVRFLASRGVYYTRSFARFTSREDYLPLDLWDSTPDP